jgi:uncharacterized protein (DUF1501 family)
MRDIARRIFLRDGAIAMLALGMPPSFLARPLISSTGRLSRRGARTLVCIFQRGAVDGLNMTVPFGEKAYYASRRSIAIPAPRRGDDASAIDLDGFFGLHPAMAPLLDPWQKGELSIIHAVGSPHPTRSHFDAQDFMESGTPGIKTTKDGWLNRTLSETRCYDCGGRTLANPAAHAADHAAGQTAMGDSPLRGVAVGGELPRSLRGAYPTLAIPDLAHFGVAGGRDSTLESTFERLYANASGDLMGAAADGSFDAIELLKKADPTQYRPAVDYPQGGFGRSMQQIAQLIKADVGLEVAFADTGGWDTHVGQGAGSGQLANRLRELSTGIRAFRDDLADLMENVVILTMSEFGRTVRENGSGGTDHGHANCMLVMGGGVRGGRILGPWPGLARDQLYEGRDLAVTSDFRDVFSEVIEGHLGTDNLTRVFPGYEVDRARYRGIYA